MGSFDIDRAALDEAYATGEGRIAVLLDGQAAPAPAAKAVPVPVAATAPAPPPADTGPGFWARLGSGISSAAKVVGDAAANMEVTVGPISGKRVNAAVQAVPPPREPRYGMIVAWSAVAVLAVAFLVGRK